MSKTIKKEIEKEIYFYTFILGVATLFGYYAILSFSGLVKSKFQRNTNEKEADAISARFIATFSLSVFVLPFLLGLESYLTLDLKINFPLLFQFFVSLFYLYLIQENLSVWPLALSSFLLGASQQVLQNGVFGMVALMPTKCFLVMLCGQTFSGVVSQIVWIGMQVLGFSDNVKLFVFISFWALVLILSAISYKKLKSLKKVKKRASVREEQRTVDEATNSFAESVKRLFGVMKKTKWHLAELFLNMASAFLVWPFCLAALYLNASNKNAPPVGFVKNDHVLPWVIFVYNMMDFASRLLDITGFVWLEELFARRTVKCWLFARTVFLLLAPFVRRIAADHARLVCVLVLDALFALQNGLFINCLFKHGNGCKKLDADERETASHLLVGVLSMGIVAGSSLMPVYRAYCETAT